MPKKQQAIIICEVADGTTIYKDTVDIDGFEKEGVEHCWFIGDFDIDGDGGSNKAKDPTYQRQTSLTLNGKPINADNVPYGVLHNSIVRRTRGRALGCLGRCTDMETGVAVWFVSADRGPEDKAGEGSIRMAELIKSVNPHPVKGGNSKRKFKWEFWVGRQAIIDGVTYPLVSSAK